MHVRSQDGPPIVDGKQTETADLQVQHTANLQPARLTTRTGEPVGAAGNDTLFGQSDRQACDSNHAANAHAPTPQRTIWNN